MGLCSFLNTRNANRKEPTPIPPQAEEPDFEFDVESEDVSPEQCKCNFVTDYLAWEVKPVYYWVDKILFNAEESIIEEITRKCFEQWATVSGLRFQRVNKELDANIRVSSSFIDGRNGTLGVAYQPSDGNVMLVRRGYMTPPFIGDIVIDNAEDWNYDSLYSVMLHEVGHALGIPHDVDDENAVMYPFALGTIEFAESDIEQIQKRYGAVDLVNSVV